MRGLLLLSALVLACGVHAEVPAGWFPFVIGELPKDSFCSVAGLSPDPAGARGFVSLREGHFFDGAGRRLRFLGTNCTFATAFPDKAQAPAIAAQMAALGINCVRFHHMDNQYKPNGIWDKAFPDRQHMDAEQLDRLDWFIYQLKQRGIYVDLNLHVSRQFGAADGFENTDALPKYDKGVDNFCARMIELQRNYARDLLTHTNPYTKTTYAQEPAVAIVELNNENSLLGFAFGRELFNLPEPYAGELRGYWLDYLKARYHDTAALRKAWDEGSEPLGAEMARDPQLATGTKEYVLESRNPKTDVFEVVDDPVVGKALHARLNTLGVNPWDFQIHQVNVPFQEGKLYTLSFRVKAVPARDLHVAARWAVTDWRNLGLNETVKAGAQWQEYSFTFRASGVNPAGNNRFSFDCLNQLGDVWIAGLSLRPGGVRGLDATQTLEAGNVAFPASNATRAARVDWFGFMVALEQRYTQGLAQYLKRDLGVKAHLVDTQASYGGLGGLWRESHMDFLDNHAYWQHPSFPGRPWDGANWTIGNTPMTAARGRDCLTRLAQQRVVGKAYTISEYNHPAPGDCRAECMPMVASFAALQDWDGVFEFDYGSTPTDWTAAKLQGYFTMVTDPAKTAFFPVAANLLRRGDVAAARGEVRLKLPEEMVADWCADKNGSVSALWDQVGVPATASINRRLVIEWTKSGEVTGTKITLPETGPIVADTGEVSWASGEGVTDCYQINTPKTKVLLGHIAGRKLKVGEVTLEIGPTANGWAAVALTSMDNLPLARSRRLLVVAMSRVENQDMQWSPTRNTVSNKWGKGPTICEQVTLQVSIQNRALKAWALDGLGKRQGGSCAAGTVLDLKAPTVWYELGE